MVLHSPCEQGSVCVLGQNGIDVIGSQTAVNVIVDGENGSQTTSTDAAAVIQRELAVGGNFAHADAQTLGQTGDQIGCALNVAGSTQTYPWGKG